MALIASLSMAASNSGTNLPGRAPAQIAACLCRGILADVNGNAGEVTFPPQRFEHALRLVLRQLCVARLLFARAARCGARAFAPPS